MNKITKIISISLGVVLAAGMAFSLPSFSAKEDVACGSCHSGYPRLNSNGLSYLANGYSFDNKPMEDAPGFRVSGAIESWFVSKDEGRSTDFQLHKFELLAGGKLSKKAGYFVEAYFEERGEFHNMGDVFIYLKPSENLSVRAGQFQPDLLLTDGERLTTRRTLLYDTKVNGWRLRNRQRGLAFTYNKDKFSGTAAVVNGNGSGAEDDHESDNNDKKDISLALSHNISDGLSIGGYLYAGTIPNGDGTEDEIGRAVVSLRQHMMDERFELNAVVGMGSNDNPNGDDIEQNSMGFFVEGVYTYKPEILLLARYDYFDSDTDLDENERWAVVPSVLYYLGENIRLSGEYVFYKDGDGDEFRAVVSAVF
jgi:hypothetical protein